MRLLKRSRDYCLVVLVFVLGVGVAASPTTQLLKASNATALSFRKPAKDKRAISVPKPALDSDTALALSRTTIVFESAEADWANQRWAAALNKFRLIANSPSPLASKAHIQIGKYFKYMGRWNEAINEYETAILKAVITRDVEDAQTSIGAVHLSKADYGKAISIFKEIISKTSDWQQIKYCTYWIKELDRRMAFGSDKAGCNSCGPNALIAFFKLKGIRLTDKEKARIATGSNEGASLDDLKRAAESKGVKLHGVKLSMQQLRKAAKPLVVLMEDPRHYVLVTKAGAKGVSIINPEYGDISYVMPAEEFGKVWKGYALTSTRLTLPLAKALLKSDEMESLRGRVCACCPDSNNGTDVPHTPFDPTCVNPTLLVNMASLNLVVQETDLSYSGRGPSVEITRAYNADDFREGVFGRGWTFNYNLVLTANPNGSVDIRRETGTIHRFNSAGGNSYFSPKGVYDTLTRNSDGTYALKLKGSNTVQKFSQTGRLIAITDRNGNSVTLQYDSSSRLASITDAVGRVTTLSYGAGDKVILLRDPMGRTVNYVYDGNMNLVSTTDMNNNIVTYTYDNPTCPGGTCSYMTSITTAKGTTNIGYATTIKGFMLTSITDAVGNRKSYQVFAGTAGPGHLIKLTDANGNYTSYDNTIDGYVGAISDATGSRVSMAYDSQGNKTSITDVNGNVTRFTYDTRGNVSGITDPLGNTAQLAYDSRDNLTRLIDPAGKISIYEYDGKDNLTKTTDPKSGVTTFTYNEFGELKTIRDARDGLTRFNYDNSGNLSSMINPVDGLDSYTYDDVGRIISHHDPNGNNKQYTYDAEDRLTKVDYADGSKKEYAYDCCRLSSVTDPSGTLRFEYDQANRLVKFTNTRNQIIQYSYDKGNNLTALTYPDGKVVRYEYDAANRLKKVTDWLNNTTVYSYDLAGNLISSVNSNGTVAGYQYDANNQLKTLVNGRLDGSVISAYKYSLNSLGNRTKIEALEPVSPVLTARNISSTYDADNRILTTAGSTFTHDNNGNLTAISGNNPATYSYDLLDRLTRASSSSQHTQYQYDGLGNRITRIVNGSTTKYIIDSSRPLSRLLAETDEGGNTTAYYIYGLGLISKVTPSGQSFFYNYDGIGSTIALTDYSGNEVNRYAYDSFGNLSADSTEMIPNSFRYAGRFGVTDEGNGLVYMRSRYYTPAIGRFVNKDPIGFFGGLNHYSYVGADPVNWIDPSGLRRQGKQNVLFCPITGGAYPQGPYVPELFPEEPDPSAEDFLDIMGLLIGLGVPEAAIALAAIRTVEPLSRAIQGDGNWGDVAYSIGGALPGWSGWVVTGLGAARRHMR
jgi:RHS repeat-associated protein